MSDLKIELDAKELANQVTNALCTSLVGQMISGFLTNRIIDEQRISREYERAVEEVARKAFIEYLANDKDFQKLLRERITKTASDQFLKQFLEKMQRQMSW